MSVSTDQMTEAEWHPLEINADSMLVQTLISRTGVGFKTSSRAHQKALGTPALIFVADTSRGKATLLQLST